MTLSPDLTLSDRYTLLERIAVGGMGEVWRARDEVLGRIVAVKVLKEEYAADPTFLRRFRDEARHTAALSHPGIANVFDYGEVGDMAFLVMELVQGEPLSAVLAREAPLPPGRTLEIVGQAGLALQAAHDAGVVHRDVKPGNLMLRPDGAVKVTDFGIARAVDAAPLTQTGLLVGTAAYVSPEQAAGRPATAASDIYSLGVVAYECLSGRRPFTGDSAVGVASAHLHATPPPLADPVPPVVADFVLRALEKDPARRQPSAGDFGRTALALATQLGPSDPAAPGPTVTAVMPTSAQPAAATAVAGRNTAPPAGADDAERRRIRDIFVAIGAAVVVVGFLLLRSCAATGPSYAQVPKVTGESYRQAVADLHARGFDATRRSAHSSHVAAGTVSRQSVDPGTRARTDRPVVLTVSSGPRHVRVDAADYLGRPLADVTADLRERHLRVRVQYAAADAAPGTVTDIGPTGSLEEGQTVTLTVAAAPAPPADKHPGKGHGRGHGPKGGHGHDD